MLILTLRTDKPEAEIGLYNDKEQLSYISWQAHRELAETIHLKIREQLEKTGKDLHKVQGIVVFAGPGSFTGLRIGITVANALAKSLPAAIAGTTGDDWIAKGIESLLTGQNQELVMPEYGAPVHITQPKH